MNRLLILSKGLRKVLIVTLLVPVFSIFLSACTVTSTQGVMLLSAFRGQQDELANYRWHITLGGHQSDVVAVALPDNFLFTNDKDDAVYFNGWVITAVSGLNLPSEILIEDSDGSRRFTVGKRQTALHRCGPWRMENHKDSITHLQDCESDTVGDYQNRIDLDGAGSIVKIAQYLAGGELLVLEKKSL